MPALGKLTPAKRRKLEQLETAFVPSRKRVAVVPTALLAFENRIRANRKKLRSGVISDGMVFPASDFRRHGISGQHVREDAKIGRIK